MEKYITFSAPIQKKCEGGKTIAQKLRFVDSFRFMSASLSDLVDNMSGIWISIECKSCMEEIKINSECCCIELKNNRLIYRCRKCKKEWKRPIEELSRKFLSVYQFCNGDFNKFVLLLREGAYPYEDMDGWEKFDETTIPPKKAFYSKLHLEGIRDTDYAHARKVCKVFGIKKCGQYHDLYAQSDTLLLADVFEDFRNMCLDEYRLYPARFSTAAGLAWQAYLKKTEVKLELLTNYDMPLMVEKGIRGGILSSNT